MSKKIKAELMAIQSASRDKMLHPANIVAWAKRNQKSALHRQFEWNNSKAAERYRLWQARQIIQVNVVTEDGRPQLVSLSFDRLGSGGYRSISDVVSDRELSEIMFNDALAELNRVQARFHRVRELTSVWMAIKRVKTRQRSKPLPRNRTLKKAA